MGDPNEFLAAVEEYVARATAPLVKRIQQLEADRARIPERGEKGEPGEDGRDAPPIDFAHISDFVKAATITALADLPRPRDGVDGKDGADADIAPAIHNLELRFVALKGDLERIVKELPVPQGERGEPGLPGKDVDEDAMLARVTARALAAMPIPKDGLAGKDGRDGVDADEAAIIARVLAAIPVPKDGVNGVDGKDGRDGLRGPPGEGLQGEPGRDALDGLSSIECALRGERTLALDFLLTGGARKSFAFTLPIPIYRGIHKDGVRYEKGDGVTRDGSTWIAAKDTDTTPPSADWTLAVKKGRDLR